MSNWKWIFKWSLCSFVGVCIPQELLTRQVMSLEFMDPPSPEYCCSFYATDVSADGSVVVGIYRPVDHQYGWRWEDGVLEILPVSFPIVNCFVAEDGNPVFGNARDGESTFPFSLDFTNPDAPAMVDLPTFGDGGRCEIRAVSEDENVYAGFGYFLDGSYQACIWQGGAVSGLDYLNSGDTISNALDISSDGAVIVGYSGSGGESPTHAVQWKNGVVSALTKLPGDESKSYVANHVTSDGTRIFGHMPHGSAPDNLYGMLFTANQGTIQWVEGIPERLEQLTNFHLIMDTSSDGSRLVINQVLWGSAIEDMMAFLATEEMDFLPVYLNEITDAQGVDRKGLYFSLANAISRDGKTIVGYIRSWGDSSEKWRGPFRLQILDMYGPYQITDGLCDSSPWLGKLWVENDPWIWSLDMNHWFYCPGENLTQSGAWVYVPK
ncbi:MAG: hypothetical protein AB3N33_06875 [Puniceicoccaceae bacterium]